MNEIRDQLRDQASTFVTKAEYRTAHDRIEEDIRSLRESRSLLEGKANQSAVIFVAAISLLGLILTIYDLVGGI